MESPDQRVCVFGKLIQISFLEKFHEFPFLQSKLDSVLFIRVRFLTVPPPHTNSNCLKTKCGFECVLKPSEKQKSFLF